MELLIKHGRPMQLMTSGKWEIKEFPFTFYVIIDEKKVIVQPKEAERNLILNLTINNKNVFGKYNKHEDCLLYVIDMEKHDLKLHIVDKFDNLNLIEFDESKKLVG